MIICLYLLNVETHNEAFYILGRVAMSMTTLLTLASMFAALVDVTPPISYTTKLDTWMITCIVFVFGTLAEFTLVIVLKYYLNNLPPISLPSRTSKPSTPSASTLKIDDATVTTISRELERTFAWGDKGGTVNSFLKEAVNSALKKEDTSMMERPRSRRNRVYGNDIKRPVANNPREEIIDDDASEDEQEIIDERRIKSDRIIKRIEKYSVIVYFLIFIIFNIWYWVDIIKCSNATCELVNCDGTTENECCSKN